MLDVLGALDAILNADRAEEVCSDEVATGRVDSAHMEEVWGVGDVLHDSFDELDGEVVHDCGMGRRVDSGGFIYLFVESIRHPQLSRDETVPSSASSRLTPVRFDSIYDRRAGTTSRLSEPTQVALFSVCY